MTETKRTIVPVGDRVTISEIAPEERTKSGLYLPPSAQRSTRTRTGTIVAMGDGVTSKAFAVGDTVILAEFAGMEVQVDGEKLLLVTLMLPWAGQDVGTHTPTTTGDSA